MFSIKLPHSGLSANFDYEMACAAWESGTIDRFHTFPLELQAYIVATYRARSRAEAVIAQSQADKNRAKQRAANRAIR